MSIYSHNIYENVRTRVVVLRGGTVLLHPPDAEMQAWSLPGGGLDPGESLAQCAAREVHEETGVEVKIGRIAFLREWVAPTYSGSDAADGYGYGIEVYHYATPIEPVGETIAEFANRKPAVWVPLADVESLPIYPKEIKLLCRRLACGAPVPDGAPSVLGVLESPWAMPDEDAFE